MSEPSTMPTLEMTTRAEKPRLPACSVTLASCSSPTVIIPTASTAIVPPRGSAREAHEREEPEVAGVRRPPGELHLADVHHPHRQPRDRRADQQRAQRRQA